jgi:hypothetical protein
MAAQFATGAESQFQFQEREGFRRHIRKNGGVNEHERERDHGDGGEPGDDVEGGRIDVLAHEVFAIHEQQHEN